ncbi:MAG: aromatic/alkene monooxygenase hydroxylase subunit beta [Alphaproteobacteria bacterium]
MADPNDLSKPLRTFSHLARMKRRPSEYEIVSTNLIWSKDDPKAPWAMSPSVPLSQWYIKYRNESPLKHDDWDAFRDPDQLVYRTYNMVQDGQESYVDGLLNDHARNEHDKGLSEAWLKTLVRLYTPGRYLVHAAQMGSAYLVQLAQSSTIENCAMFQAADQLRWVQRIAYRTRELAKAHPALGFGESERGTWEGDPAWQGFRELVEKALVAYDWGEHVVALNLVVKPAIDEAYLRQLGKAARCQGDTLLGLLNDAALIDSDRSRRWTKALIDFVAPKGGNKAVLDGWVAKWAPLGDKAITAYCAALPDHPDGAGEAKAAVSEWRRSLGFAA